MGLIAVVAIQRAIHKVLISVFLTREFKHDETNRAWWTGRWYGRGLGTHAISQPARELIVKIIELSLWSSDLLIGHFLLFMMTRCFISWRRTPNRDRIEGLLSRHYLEREMAERERQEMEQRILRSSSLLRPPPPPYISAPAYEEIAGDRV